jgi:nitrilase
MRQDCAAQSSMAPMLAALFAADCLSRLDHLTPDTLIEKGGSAIIAPDGRYLAGPVFDQETILHASLDLTEIDRECMTLDVTGHYSRPDIFRFSVLQDEKG